MNPNRAIPIKSMKTGFDSLNNVYNLFMQIIQESKSFKKRIPFNDVKNWTDEDIRKVEINIFSIDAVFDAYRIIGDSDSTNHYHLVARQIINNVPIYFKMKALNKYTSYYHIEGTILFSKSPTYFVEEFSDSNIKREMYYFLEKSLNITAKRYLTDEEKQIDIGVAIAVILIFILPMRNRFLRQSIP